MFAEWTDRIMAGEVPPRPNGVERNLVLTEWAWSNPRGFTHDEVAKGMTSEIVRFQIRPHPLAD